MKKRLLLILAIGIAFAPAVFADGGIGSYNRPSTDPGSEGQMFCQVGITSTKSVSGSASSNTNGSGDQASGQAAQANTISD